MTDAHLVAESPPGTLSSLVNSEVSYAFTFFRSCPVTEHIDPE